MQVVDGWISRPGSRGEHRPANGWLIERVGGQVREVGHGFGAEHDHRAIVVCAHRGTYVTVSHDDRREGSHVVAAAAGFLEVTGDGGDTRSEPVAAGDADPHRTVIGDLEGQAFG